MTSRTKNTFRRRKSIKTKSSTASLWARYAPDLRGALDFYCLFWDVMVTRFCNWFGGILFLCLHHCGLFFCLFVCFYVMLDLWRVYSSSVLLQLLPAAAEETSEGFKEHSFKIKELQSE